MGTFWFILQTLYLYLLTLLNFIIGSAGVFYPSRRSLYCFSCGKCSAASAAPRIENKKTALGRLVRFISRSASRPGAACPQARG